MLHLKFGYGAAATAILGSAAAVGVANEIPTPLLYILQPIVDSAPMFSLGLLGILFWIAKRFMDLVGPEIKDQAVKVIAMPDKEQLAALHNELLSKISSVDGSLASHRTETAGLLGELRGDISGVRSEIASINARLNSLT